MLESLEGINFQKHSQVEIHFDPKITIITGDSDIGKSALLRLIRWISLNQPGGDGIIREGSLFAFGKLKIDGHEIVRKKGKGENLYELDGNEFRAFGVGVPDPIADVLRIGPQNFQGQLDPVFWLQSSGGEISRQLNSVVDLSIVDKALGEISGKVRHAQSMVQTTSERLKGLKLRKQETEWIKDADRDYQIVEGKKETLDKLTSFVFRLGKAIDTVREETERVDQAKKRLEDIRCIGALAALCGRIGEKVSRLSQILKDIHEQQEIVDIGVPDFSGVTDRFEKFKAIRTNRERLETLLHQAQRNQQLAADIPDFSGVQAAFEKHQTCVRQRTSLEKHLVIHRSTHKLAERTLKAWQEDLEQLWLDTEGACPLCGNPLTEDKETKHGHLSSK